MINGERAGESAIAVEVEKDKSYYWCSCGKSAKQPFCDGSHKGTNFTPLAYKAEETKKMFFCDKPVWVCNSKYVNHHNNNH